ncbi:MAG: GNAT family N-acetyltransferase [Clostridiales bacterium]|nr:GNAT family N-acetyltransferase [Clostridiales bacterium]
MNVYENCPTYENDEFIIRLTIERDIADLLKVYSDEKALPLFNSDNCHGDDFHYTTLERMRQAFEFWEEAYRNGWFVRWSVVDKSTNEAVGTIEEFHRDAGDHFDHCGLLRLDLRSDYEVADKIASILSLIVPPSFDLFGCKMVATKAPAAATERIKALTSLGFTPSDKPLVGHDGTKYYAYYELNK